MGNWLNWPYWRRPLVARFTLLGQCLRARSSNVDSGSVACYVTLCAMFVRVASRLRFVHLDWVGDFKKKRKKHMMQFFLFPKSSLLLGFWAFLWVNVEGSMPAGVSWFAPQEKIEKKGPLVNVHPNL